MSNQACPHYANPTSTGGVSRCRACGVVMGASPTSAAPRVGEYPGTAAAASTALGSAKAGNVGSLAHTKTA